MVFDIRRIDQINPESEDAERQFEKYQNDLLAHFFDSPEGKKRLEEDPDMGGWTVHLMDYGYNYLGVTVTRMTAGSVREIVEDIFPRKISLQSPADADYAIPELRAFWEYLKREFRLPQAEAVLNLLTKIEPDFRNIMNDSSRFGMAKSFFMMGQAAGFDMTSQEGMNAFMLEYNARQLAEQGLPGGGSRASSLLSTDNRRKSDRKSEKTKRKQAQASRRKNRKRRK